MSPVDQLRIIKRVRRMFTAEKTRQTKVQRMLMSKQSAQESRDKDFAALQQLLKGIQ
jgi:hypothetical protein